MSNVFGKAVWGIAIALMVLTSASRAESKDGKQPGHQTGKLDTVLASRSSGGGRLPVIITVKNGTKPGVRRMLQAHGNPVVSDHWIVNAITARVHPEDLAELAGDPDVVSISTDADVAPSATTTTTDYSTVVSDLKQWLDLGNWFTGSTITVAVIDSGIYDNGDFTGRILGTYEFTGGKLGVPLLPSDEFGHGTHVAGLIGASGALSAGQFAGVASGIKFLSLKALDQKGAGKTSDVINALEFAVANKSRFGIRVINLSLGHPIFESAVTDPLVQAVEAAVRAGIVVVVAAGNYGTNPTTGATGYAGIASPGNAPSAITVGAANAAGTVSRQDDRVAPYSSRGPSWFDGFAKPDVLAPGQALLSDNAVGSTLSTTYPSLVQGQFLRLSGSSMATGVVSGLVAVMIEANDYVAYQRYQSSGRLKKGTVYVPPPPLTPNAIKAMLQYSATRLHDANGVVYDPLTQGAGEVNGLGAVELAAFADTSQTAGSAWLAHPVDPNTIFDTTNEPWSQQIIWGTRLVGGSGIIDVNQSAWQMNIVWGTGELENIVWGTYSEDDQLIWGASYDSSTDIVWAGSADWGENIVWGTGLVGYFNGENIVWGTLSDENIVWGTSKNVSSLGLTGGVQ